MADAGLYSVLTAGFSADPDRAVLETPDGTAWSCADLEAAAAGFAAALAGAGARPGDRIAVQADKSPQALALYLGCLRAGLVHVPLNTAYTDDERDVLLRDAAPRVFVHAPGRAPGRGGGAAGATAATLESLAARAAGAAAPAVAAAAADDPAAIVYTSGTTGRPKGAVLSHGNLASNGRTLARLWGFAAGDVLLHALPLYHVHGLFVAVHCALIAGARLLFLPRFDAAEAAALLPRATVMMGVPTYYSRLLARPEFGRRTCRGVRLFVSGSAPLRPATFAAFRERTGHAILERYGMTEAGMIASNPLARERTAGSVGFPLPGVAVRIAGDDDRPLPAGATGMLQVRGPSVFRGYWRRPDATGAAFAADGFFRTGDLARQDADGRIAIMGRAGDLIITGGLNVWPREVEQHIDAIDGVAESAVVGLPDDDFGEIVVAAVCRAEDGAGLAADDVKAALRGRLAGFKQPKRIAFVDALPRNAMGKVLKAALRARLQG